eukprot:12404338-Ditylum_brightwellii.AAC.1
MGMKAVTSVHRAFFCEEGATKQEGRNEESESSLIPTFTELTIPPHLQSHHRTFPSQDLIPTPFPSPHLFEPGSHLVSSPVTTSFQTGVPSLLQCSHFTLQKL